VQLTGNLGVEGKLRLCGWGTGMAGTSSSVTESAIAVVDIDGTLIDSNYQHALAWYWALRSVGETYPVWRSHRLIGMGGDQVLTAVGGEDLERRVGDQAREQHGKEVDALLEEMAPLPGARDLLVAIKERGHRLVLASSGQQRHVDVFLDKLDARDIADDWTTSADVEASKPAPDLLQVALNKLGAPPDASSVMVGDSVGDVEAAKKAGMPGDRRPLRRLWGRRAPGGGRHRHLRQPRRPREGTGRHPTRLTPLPPPDLRPDSAPNPVARLERPPPHPKGAP
jgi:HAD superfamily hydrolase (TIGR01549 family)